MYTNLSQETGTKKKFRTCHVTTVVIKCPCLWESSPFQCILERCEQFACLES